MALNTQKKLNGITYDNLLNVFKNEEYFLIDLREESEILKKPSLNNSINIPYSNLQDYINKNKKSLESKNIIFYCAVGERSALAIQICQSYKFKHIKHLIGGINNI